MLKILTILIIYYNTNNVNIICIIYIKNTINIINEHKR